MPGNCTEAEWMILELLWESAPRSSEEITHALQASTGWTQHAVETLLKRMQEKQTISVQETEELKRYIANGSRRDTCIAPMKRRRPLSGARRNAHENGHRV